MLEAITNLMQQPLVISALKISVVIVFLLTYVSYAMMFERWISAWIQDRWGPNRVGPFGLLQPIADGVKLLLKEDVIPGHVNKLYYVLAPCIAMVPAVVSFGVIPFGSKLSGVPMVIADLDIGVLFIFAIASLGVYGIVLAGWSSNSKYPFLGGIRSSAQMISYELCLGLSVVSVFMMTGTLRMGGFDESGRALGVIGYQLEHGWLVLYQPLAFFIFLISAFAETNRLPFDLPEAEQELVGGYHTEYSSMKWAMFFLGEYVAMFTASAVMVTLFFGGWSLPFAPFNAPATTLWVGIAHICIFVAKVLFFIFVYMWVRWTIPRFRFDQLMHLGWKVFLPLALANVFITGLLMALLVKK